MTRHCSHVASSSTMWTPAPSGIREMLRIAHPNPHANSEKIEHLRAQAFRDRADDPAERLERVIGGVGRARAG